MSDGEDFFLEADDQISTVSQLTKRKRRVSHDNRNVKKQKIETNESDDEELDQHIGFSNLSSGEESAEEEDSESEKETAAEKRLRMAQNYLQALSKQEGHAKIDDAKAGLSTRLQEEAQEAQGRLVREYAKQIKEKIDQPPKVVRVLKGHQLPPTCVAVTEDGSMAISGSKDCSVIQWDLETGKKLITRGGRKSDTSKACTRQVLAVAVTSDNKYFATGGRDNLVRIWDTRSNTIVNSFKGHKDAVTSLAFRKDSYQLFSGSEDRSIKIWNLDPMMYTESLYGHQSGVMGIDSLYKERAISCGVDHTCRIWKIVEESQLLYRGHNASIDCISQINEEVFVAGSQDGSISLWNAGHKRPNFVYNNAHGNDNPWISSICALPFSDFVASGSNDGNLKFWEFSKSKQILSRIYSLPMVGFINGIGMPRSGNFLVAAVGQEHRLGRWWRNKEARNSIQIVSLPFSK